MSGAGDKPRQLWRRHLTYANVMSTLAVFLVLAGGTAVAAVRLHANSVTSKKVKDNSLQSVDLADGAGVTGADVADGSLSGPDVAAGSVTGADLAAGSLDGGDIADGSIGGADLGKGAVAAPQLLPNVVDSAKVLNNSLRGSDFGVGALLGANIDESTLAPVPEAVTLGGRLPSGFVSNEIYELVGAFAFGAETVDGAFLQTMQCENPTDLLLGGGPSDTGPGGNILEDAPAPGGSFWEIVMTGGAGLWREHVICARRHTP